MLYQRCLNSGYIFLMFYIWILVSWQCTEKIIWDSEACSGSSPWKQLRKAIPFLENGNMLSSYMLTWMVAFCSNTCRGVVYYSIVIQQLLWICSELSCGHLIRFCVPVLKWLALVQLTAFRADKSTCIHLSSLAHLKLHTWNTWKLDWSQLRVPVASHFCLATIQFHSCR